ncbi:MAG: DUF1830 domain-containing protein [Oscillatoriales cyanobacterium SM2_1_8]|nr:DUF1830 domain-containing protein [Oscillatoriales cyanobacterium SM2_1_8]
MLLMSALDPIPAATETLVCCYVNATGKMQVARITNIDNWYFERVVFPGQHLMFEAPPMAVLEIHSGMMASSILSDTIPCDRLQIEEVDSLLPEWLPRQAVTEKPTGESVELPIAP